ncbi:MAG: DnaJ domain-containing protein [Selenomonadaceae bacterium]|nr:DnaJ domain-containing protein [Selenomonadaceae bacterium]
MTYYEILGVDRNATAQELKKAYRALARKWHPDLNRDNPEVAEKKMTEINVAYSVLSDEVSRIDYNKKLDAESAQSARSRRTTAGKTQTSQRNSAESSAQNSSQVDFGNINNAFESFFGFDPKTKTVTNEDKLNTFAKTTRKKNPLDTTDFFEKFMGIKR